MKFSATKDFAKWFWVTRGTNIILQKWVEPAKFVAVISQNFFLQNNGCCKISANAWMPVTSPSRPNVWLALYQHGLVWRTTWSFELATFFQVLERLPPRLPCRTFSPDRKRQKVRIISSGWRDVSGLWPVHALGRHHPKKERLLRRPRRRSGIRRRLWLKLRKPLGSNPQYMCQGQLKTSPVLWPL